MPFRVLVMSLFLATAAVNHADAQTLTGMGGTKQRVEAITLDLRRTIACYSGKQQTISQQDFSDILKHLNIYQASGAYIYGNEWETMNEAAAAQADKEVKSNQINSEFCQAVKDRLGPLLETDDNWPKLSGN